MLSFKDLTHVSFVHPTSYDEDFYGLKNLYIDRLPVIIGHRGNLYKITITEHWTPWMHDSSYRVNTRCKIDIWDITNNKIAGEGDFVYACKGSPYSYAITEIREEIKNALIRLNVKPTDFYK